ncbi:transcriptional regulator [Geobacillus sp. LEMMY01]|uniref:transcriptional regulator n=1 Tax=Geobacillus sp. LEMMY01 TaxID=1954237 RepID=UPI0009ACEEBE|nr:transcriptional regulator [Geobacillus sp. LEMMY01]OPW98778.1 transcriptional regulator [Geobacillus sp. LEMMY01]
MAGGISYHAKDILFKSLSELYQNQALDVYGLHGLPRIKALLPNEFPAVRADEKRSDTLFLLEDASILLPEYESNQRFIDNHLKYLDYAYRILHTYYKQEKQIKPIRIVVIYTSDVTSAHEQLHAGDVLISSKAVLLCEYNGDAIFHTIEEKIRHNEPLTAEETMKFILVPLMHSRFDRQTMIEKTIELAKEIHDESTQLHVIAGILTATDKFIDEQYAKKVKEWIKMTKVMRLLVEELEQEKEAAVKEAVKEAEKQKAVEIAKNFLDVLPIHEVAKRTGLTVAEVADLAKEKSN